MAKNCRPRGRVAPSVDVAGAETEGITGGLVLDSTPGLYDHILVFDHVLGAHPDRFEGRFRPPYTHQTPFHEPFVLFGFLAAVTQRIELTSRQWVAEANSPTKSPDTEAKLRDRMDRAVADAIPTESFRSSGGRPSSDCRARLRRPPRICR